MLAGRVEGERQETLQPIRITPHYVTDNISDDSLRKLQSNNGPIKSAIRYFQSFLSVSPFNESLKAPPTCRSEVDVSLCPPMSLVPAMCGPHVLIPADHTGELVTCNIDMSQCQGFGANGEGVADSDYVLYVTSQQDGNKVLHC